MPGCPSSLLRAGDRAFVQEERTWLWSQVLLSAILPDSREVTFR